MSCKLLFFPLIFSCLNTKLVYFSNDGHFGSSSKKHGVDMDAVRKNMKRIGEAKNVVMVQKVLCSFCISLTFGNQKYCGSHLKFEQILLTL